MKKTHIILFLLMLLAWDPAIKGQDNPDKIFQVRGFCISAPKPTGVDRFVKFINEELVPRKVNTLVLLVGYNYQYKTYPQLRDSGALSKKDVKKIVKACRSNNIRIIPDINLLGHQSSGNRLNKLLQNFPEFDETPHIQMPEKYVWPNKDNLYCKSYCPRHPDVHKVVFACVDELCDVFEADAFHAGMDEIFYLGDDKCPRCQGVDKAVLFADEVTLVRNHLKTRNRELWLWADRFLDGRATGIGFWEASYNYTYRAIDMVPKDIVMCDWHYERPDQTAIYFALKGFRVITCPWRTPSTAEIQTEDMAKYVKYATPEMKPRYYGMMQTCWTSTEGFIDGFYGTVNNRNQRAVHPKNSAWTPWDTFRAMYKKMDELEAAKQK